MKLIDIKKDEDKTIFICSGDWTLYNSYEIHKSIKEINKPKSSTCIIDFSGVSSFDSSGILLLLEFKEHLQALKNSCKILGLSKKQQGLLELIKRSSYNSNPLPKRQYNILYRIGKATLKELETLEYLFTFIGELSISFFRLLLNPKNFRFKEIVYHIQKSGFNALFIIGLTSFLVGLVIAYESLVQLAQFGADIYVVDGIGITITRELGPMITAIVIAGRSASSYAAEIGTMKITEEISAMKTMGFDPYYFLIFPRIFALIISLPLLIFFSDIIGIIGGMIATKIQADISYKFFIERLQEVLDVKQYILGIIKAPFFALIIATTGCFHGFRVTGDTESIGIETTSSVVHAIFFVIACDALFAIFYTQMGF